MSTSVSGPALDRVLSGSYVVDLAIVRWPFYPADQAWPFANLFNTPSSSLFLLPGAFGFVGPTDSDFSPTFKECTVSNIS